MKRKQIPLGFTIFAMILLILDSSHAGRYAAEGIDLCLRSVIPALFPFLILSIYLTGNLAGSTGLGSVLICGFLGGYPTGAQSAAELWRTCRISREYANRLLLFCSQAGPAFIFGMLAAQFPGFSYLWKLWAVQILSAISVSTYVPLNRDHNSVSPAFAPLSLPSAMQRALRAMASVCGWVVSFRVLMGYLARVPLQDETKVLFSGLIELTNGCMSLHTVEDVSLRFILAALMLNFGGVCVVFQTASAINGLDIRYYLLGKVLQTGFSLLFSLCFLGYFPALIPIFSAFLIFQRRNLAKRGSIPAPVGV